MRVVPIFKDPAVTQYLTELVRDTERKEKDRMSAITANRALLLYSPSKKVYEITVDDSGVITATHIAG